MQENIKVSAVMKLETLPEEDSPAERAAATDGSAELEADQVQLFLQKEHMLLQMVFSMEDNPAHTGVSVCVCVCVCVCASVCEGVNACV